mmetsp:Transcript_1927/g.3459  ORF Transcript_1927/g.3459 Transcript_1927/m.3459 type:complete len:106 (-) Transcript_1927:1695-2012(-)
MAINSRSWNKAWARYEPRRPVSHEGSQDCDRRPPSVSSVEAIRQRVAQRLKEEEPKHGRNADCSSLTVEIRKRAAQKRRKGEDTTAYYSKRILALFSRKRVRGTV